MTQLGAPPSERLIAPQGEDALERFTCGAGTGYEVEVDAIVEDLYQGSNPNVQMVLLEDASTGSPIGLCGFEPRVFAHPLDFSRPEDHDAFYITVIAIHENYRGVRLPDGERIGALLLRRALEAIDRKHGGPVAMGPDGPYSPMPLLWAFIARSNSASLALFERFDFAHAVVNGDYEFAVREAGLPPHR